MHCNSFQKLIIHKKQQADEFLNFELIHPFFSRKTKKFLKKGSHCQNKLNNPTSIP